jgi:thiol-disulfide isomerase/thioredoxin
MRLIYKEISMKKFMMVLMVLCVLVGCETEPETTEMRTYEDYVHLTRWDDLDDLKDGTVLVYYYSFYCSACQSIKEDIFDYADANPTIPIFFMATGDIRSQGSPPTHISYVPSLLVYDDHVFVELHSGATSVMDYLERI